MLKGSWLRFLAFAVIFCVLMRIAYLFGWL